jgi:hypothetical protein
MEIMKRVALVSLAASIWYCSSSAAFAAPDPEGPGSAEPQKQASSIFDSDAFEAKVKKQAPLAPTTSMVATTDADSARLKEKKDSVARGKSAVNWGHAKTVGKMVVAWGASELALAYAAESELAAAVAPFARKIPGAPMVMTGLRKGGAGAKWLAKKMFGKGVEKLEDKAGKYWASRSEASRKAEEREQKDIENYRKDQQEQKEDRKKSQKFDGPTLIRNF